MLSLMKLLQAFCDSFLHYRNSAFVVVHTGMEIECQPSYFSTACGCCAIVGFEWQPKEYRHCKFPFIKALCIFFASLVCKRKHDYPFYTESDLTMGLLSHAVYSVEGCIGLSLHYLKYFSPECSGTEVQGGGGCVYLVFQSCKMHTWRQGCYEVSEVNAFQIFSSNC